MISSLIVWHKCDQRFSRVQPQKSAPYCDGRPEVESLRQELAAARERCTALQEAAARQRLADKVGKQEFVLERGLRPLCGACRVCSWLHAQACMLWCLVYGRREP